MVCVLDFVPFMCQLCGRNAQGFVISLVERKVFHKTVFFLFLLCIMMFPLVYCLKNLTIILSQSEMYKKALKMKVVQEKHELEVG